MLRRPDLSDSARSATIGGRLIEKFDVLIIGAGSSGSVLANRLSADESCTVGLIEAGGFPTDPDISDPLKWPALQGRDYDRDYVTTPQPETAERVHRWARGRIIGGSSCLHAMAHVRGHPDDFDSWKEAGGARWSFGGLLPGFQKSENFTAFQMAGRGADGPLDVYLPDEEISPLVTAYMRAGQSLGVPKIRDHNSGELIGTAPNSLNIRAGRRLSVADAYLTSEVLARKNLTIMTGVTVEKLLFEGTRAKAVRLTGSDRSTDVFADQIVLAAGAIDTPLLAMRSGIGDAEALANIGIECRIDRREVGKNLQDHLLVLGNVYRSKQPVPPSRLQHSESLMYLNSADLRIAQGKPDIVLACVVAPSVAFGLDAPEYGTAYTFLCGVTHPTSRGHIKLGGPSLGDKPLIDPRYLETEYDRDTLRAALQIARRVGCQSALDDWRLSEVLPGEEIQSDAALDRFIAKAASTHHHPAGTCRLGRDEDAVVDPDLRLRGLDNVYVVDASIMPTLPSGPINAAVVAIAETWAGIAPDLLNR